MRLALRRLVRLRLVLLFVLVRLELMLAVNLPVLVLQESRLAVHHTLVLPAPLLLRLKLS